MLGQPACRFQLPRRKAQAVGAPRRLLLPTAARCRHARSAAAAAPVVGRPAIRHVFDRARRSGEQARSIVSSTPWRSRRYKSAADTDDSWGARRLLSRSRETPAQHRSRGARRTAQAARPEPPRSSHALAGDKIHRDRRQVGRARQSPGRMPSERLVWLVTANRHTMPVTPGGIIIP